ncbi:MAG TPA: DNA polymerase [Actinomycetales bacterium]|nr:DNA polymerase [Actinomycetales bacterium]
MLEALADLGVVRGDAIALAVSDEGVGLRCESGGLAVACDLATAAGVLGRLEDRWRPRWVWWSAGGTASLLLPHGVRVAVCWDVAAVHRLLSGGTDDDPARVWATLADLDPADVPRTGQLDLLGTATNDADGDPEQPVLPSGHLRAEWTAGGWRRTPRRLASWADLGWQARQRQLARLQQVPCSGDAVGTALSESAAELLCVELAHDGLPIDRDRAEQLVAQACGERPRDQRHEASQRQLREELVLRHVPAAALPVDLRNPAQVRAALAAVGIDVPDTRSWRLEAWRAQHPLVEALLAWRKADRIATTYGYRWLDEHVGPDDRLRGAWSGSDGAAGRMTAQAGLHNLPSELRPAVAAEPGHVLVRADLGQVEPRVLAAVSGDEALAAATADDDLYLPVARRLGVERSVAKVAVLAAMYGQTSGTAGQALEGLERAYPVAMRYLRAAYEHGRAGQAVRTHGGRLVRMYRISSPADERDHRAAVNARGRFARNAVIQGSAAELFKAWAATVRAACRRADAQIVLCLHDELLVHAPAPAAQEVVDTVHRTLADVAGRWTTSGRGGVRFVADVSVVHRWSEAKG